MSPRRQVPCSSDSSRASCPPGPPLKGGTMLTRTRRRAAARGAVAALATAVLAVAVPGAPALGAPTDSTFEAQDGNQVVDGTGQDWVSFANRVNCAPPFADCALDLATGSGDDAFGQGSKDDQTTLRVVDGSIPN